MDLRLLILLIVLLAGVLWGIFYLRKYRTSVVDTEDAVELCAGTGDACYGGSACHLHRQLKVTRKAPVYFDDEELDRFRGRRASDYTTAEVAEWEEVFRTLLDSEVIEWVGSIHRRGLLFPKELQPEIKARLEA